MMKSCDIINFTLDAHAKDMPATKPLITLTFNIWSDIPCYVDPLKQILDRWINTYKLAASIKYLDINMQWKKLICPKAFNPAFQYNPAMEVYIKMHMAYKIRQHYYMAYKISTTTGENKNDQSIPPKIHNYRHSMLERGHFYETNANACILGPIL